MTARERGSSHAPSPAAAGGPAMAAYPPGAGLPGARPSVADPPTSTGYVPALDASPGLGAAPVHRPAPGRMPVVMAALSIGLLLMAVQLWLLTVALDLYMAGAGQRAWQLALASGAIFLGGVLVLWLLRDRRATGPVMSAPPVPADGSRAVGPQG